MIDDHELQNILDIAVRNSSAVIKKYFSQQLIPEYKTSAQDLVTKADYESQNIIQETIKKLLIKTGVKLHEIGFIGEENNLYVKGKYLFAIDPIDGTVNFASGIDYFVISIGCFVDGELQYGIIHEPLKGITYYAKKGAGSFKQAGNKKTKLEIIPRELSKCLLATYFHTNADIRKQEMAFIQKIFPFMRGVRIMGSGALDLAKLADNIFQMCYFGKSNIWDIAAANLIVEEAGGIMTDLEGKKIQFDLNDPKKNYPLVAGHPDCIHRLLKLAG